MNVAVLVSSRTDPVSGRATRNRNDALAVALALEIAPAAEVRLLHAGTMSDAVARDYLALGAPTIDVIEPAGGDTASQDTLVHLLAEALGETRLVLAGTRANDAFGSGVLPFALAAALRRPVIVDVIDLRREGSAWIVTQALPKGARRRLRLAGPAVLAVSPGTTLALRHSYADRIAGQVRRRGAVAPRLAASAAPRPAEEQRVPAARRLKPLEAQVAQSGHARMQAAVGSPASAGGTVISTGSPEDKARAVLHYLRNHALVNF